MNLSARFAGVLATLPPAVKERLGAGAEVDWDSLPDRAEALGNDVAARPPARLPPSLESLVRRLVADVGISPADVASGVEGSGVAAAWTRDVKVEPDGERYRLRMNGSEELLAGVRPAALLGYAVLGLELAAAVHQACEAWGRAGVPVRTMPDDDRDVLAQCVQQMRRRLRADPGTGPGPVPTLRLARCVEDGWNALALQVRETLAARQFDRPGVAHAPRANYYEAETGYRLHAYDIEEARWLQALAEHAQRRAPARTGAGPADALPTRASAAAKRIAAGPGLPPVRTQTDAAAGRAQPDRPADAGDGAAAAGARAGRARDDAGPAAAPSARPAADNEAAGRSDSERASAAADPVPTPPSGAGIRPGATPARPAVAPVSGETNPGASLFFGTPMKVRSPAAEIDLLVQAAQRVPAAVTRRIAEVYGDGTAGMLNRLQDPDSIRDLRDALGAEGPADALPGWLDDLAAKLLLDTGAQTRDGLRTGPARLDPHPRGGGCRVTDTENSAWGVFAPIDMVEQVRLGLGFASDTWSAVTLLGDAGKEADWTLHDDTVKRAQLTNAERTRLQAAQRIEQELQRVRRVHADGSSLPPSALEEAALTANALQSLRPSERADAGWPADVGVPNPRRPGDVARGMAAAETLHREVRAIANRLIAAWLAGGRVEPEARAG